MNEFKIQKDERDKTWYLRCFRCDTHEALESQQQGFRAAKVHYNWWHKIKPLETRGWWSKRMYG